MSQNIIQMQNHYALGAMTGIVEVFLTQPIDNHKTRSQVVVHFGKKGHFVGMLPRLIGILPIRAIFWGTTLTMHDRGLHPITTGMIAGSAKTIVDCPVENFKTAKVLGTKAKPFRGLFVHTLRNIGFAISVAAGLQYDMAPIGAVLGCIVTQPLDSIKTRIQSGLVQRSVFAGLVPRTAQAFIAMSIGQAMIHTNNILKE